MYKCPWQTIVHELTVGEVKTITTSFADCEMGACPFWVSSERVNAYLWTTPHCSRVKQ